MNNSDSTTTQDLGGPHTSDLATKASLVILSGANSGSSFLVEDEMLIGRAADCNVHIEAADVSRYHATVKRSPTSEFVLLDLESHKGTSINGIPIRRQTLKFGDRIQLGTGVILMFTHHDRLAEQLLHQQRMEAIGRLAGGIAHDFNNLLGTIVGNVGMLQKERDELDDQDIEELLDDVSTAAHRAAELTKQLLGFARQDKHKMVHMNLSSMLEEVVRMSRRTLGTLIEIQTSIDSNLFVVGDTAQLHQVFMNLLINGRDAMPDGGKLTLSAKRADYLGSNGPTVVVKVSDTGVGMDEDTRDHVFEPFFTTKGMGRGTGLGLATVYGITKGHGGDVQVTSEPGQGSTFTVRLVAAPNERSIVNTGPTDDIEDIKRGTVLAVDDDELILKTTARMLQRCGYAVLTASTGQQAADILESMRDNIDVVLLDVMMPGMDGPHTCRVLRSIKPDIRVLVMSGFSDDATARGVRSIGAHGFICKPFDRETLAAEITKVIESEIELTPLPKLELCRG